jgi:hypothetical protein
LAFIDRLELPRKPGARRGSSARVVPKFTIDSKNQAMVIGSEILSFVAGVEADLRAAIMNCSLLAQLAANHAVPSRENVQKWYKTYFDVLEQLGWVVQDRGFSEHREAGDQFEAYKAILSVATAVLGASTPALALVQTTLDSLKDMSKGTWMTIFQRESLAARAARFQITVAEPSSHDGVRISLMAFQLEVTTNLTQVLVFKSRSVDVKFRHSSGRVAIDQTLLVGVAPIVAKKVADYAQNCIANIPL